MNLWLLFVACRCHGFPDVVLWKPKGFKEKTGVSDNGIDWKSKTHFGLDWRGLGGGWEVREGYHMLLLYRTVGCIWLRFHDPPPPEPTVFSMVGF